jgi:hypothetical protein
MAITPVQYANAFRNLRIFLDNADAPDPPTPMALEERGRTPPVLMRAPRLETLDVKSYLMVSGAPGKTYYSQFGQKLKQAIYIQAKIMRLDGSIETLSVPYADISYALIAPFWGKGYPEECQLALQLWDWLKLGPPEIKSIVAEDGSIGLDCNGFVGGYLERSANPAQWRRSQGSLTGAPINELMQRPGATLNALADLSPPEGASLLFGLCDANSGVIRDYNDSPVGHVVISEPGSARKRADGLIELTVAESTGHVGITTSTYTILSLVKLTPSGGIFKVQRGSKKGMAEEFATFKIRRLS